MSLFRIKPPVREPHKPLRFAKPAASPAYGIAWYRPEQWDALRAAAADADALEATHAEWEAGARRKIEEMKAREIALEPVPIDVEDLIAWCAERKIPLDASARSAFAGVVLERRRGGAGAARAIAGGPGAGGPPLPTPDAYFAERAALHGTLGRALGEPLARAADLVTGTIRDGGTVFFFGNGGSAADAQHLATELVERLLFDRPGFRAYALTTNTSLLTATANDRGYDDVFARQVETLARPGDLLVAISTSGKSPSVLRALESGRRAGIARLGLTGRGGGAMPPLCDLCLVVPSDDTQKVQEVHIAIGHYLCMAVESRLAG